MILEALRRNPQRSRVSTPKNIQTPVKGLIALENKSVYVPGAALILENFFPKPDTVILRGGFDEHSDTAEAVAVNTLMPYHGTSANKLFAVCNDTIYDATSSTASATTITGLGTSKCHHVNFTTSGGTFLFVVNGTDDAVHYNGTVWATPSITGTTSDNFNYVAVFKGRLYFAVNNSLEFAYLPVNSVAGAASTFNLGDVFNKGGTLVAIGTWTHDGGTGADDHIVFLTSQGQVAVYQGSDPSDANAWSLVGVYELARPLGTRCLERVGGDLYVNTELGILPMSQALKLDAAALAGVAVTRNIAPLLNDAASRYKTNFGWQMIAAPKHSMAIVNVPISEGVQQVQYVMNSQTGAWCKFTGLNAACWGVLDGTLYFGGNDGKVYRAFETASDNGSDIIGDMLTTYYDFGAPSRLKSWKLIKPMIYGRSTVSPLIGLNVDYVETAPTGTIEAGSSATYLWGGTTWGGGLWSGGLALSAKWRPITDRPGYVAGVRMKVSASGSGSPLLLQVNGFDITYEVGGVM